jgi:nucleotide-binding universal stress UspA family protein
MRLLLCTDGSTNGQSALRFGGYLAHSSTEPVTLLGVVERPRDRAAIGSALDEGRRLLPAHVSTHVKIRQGHAAEEILDEIIFGAYDLVAVGALGKRGVTRFMLGSTAERVARYAAVPVLIIQGVREGISRVLICTAAGEPGLTSVSLGGRVASLVGAQTTVLHVMSQVAAAPGIPPSSLEHLEATADVLIAQHTLEGLHLEQALAILQSQGVNADARVRHGLVVDEILAEVCEGDYDLVVVGAHPNVGVMRFLLDDIAHQIISHTERPVLVARMQPPVHSNTVSAC